MAENPIGATPANSVSLSLRLLKVTSVAQALKGDHGLQEMESEIGSLWVGQSPPHPPGWVKFLGQLAPMAAAELKNQSCAAILFIETQKPTKCLFAICFGQGHHALNDSAIERGFGLRVTLNQVPPDRLRTIDSAALDSTVMQHRTQASRNADLIAFEVDTDRELIRLASGAPTSGTFAKLLTGRDALNIRHNLNPRDIVHYCEQALEIYNRKTYQENFSFIDHVQPITDKIFATTLDELAFNEIKSLFGGGQSDLHLAIPDILVPEDDIEIGYFGTGLNSGRKTVFCELSIKDYISELKKGNFSSISDMITIKGSHEVCVIRNWQADRAHHRKLYSCLVYETQYQGQVYVLFDGQWYLIDHKFHTEIENKYQSLLSPAFLAKTTAKNERQLTTALSKNIDLLCLDQGRASPAGAPGANLEPCDFLSTTRQLIHLKDGHGSAPLSHLWNQGLVSTESFVRDATFRSNFRKVVAERERKYVRSGFLALIPDGRTKPVPTDFTIVYGVMRHAHTHSKTLNLPFFSKIALRTIAQRIELMGFKVELHLILKI